MFKWLRDKMLTGSEGEFRKCIDMCHTFIKFAEEQESEREKQLCYCSNLSAAVCSGPTLR